MEGIKSLCGLDGVALLDALEVFVETFLSTKRRALTDEQEFQIQKLPHDVLKRWYRLVFGQRLLFEEFHTASRFEAYDIDEFWERSSMFGDVIPGDGMPDEWFCVFFEEDDTESLREVAFAGYWVHLPIEDIAKAATSFTLTRLFFGCSQGIRSDVYGGYLPYRNDGDSWGWRSPGSFVLENMRQVSALFWYHDEFVSDPCWYAVSSCGRYVFGEDGAYEGVRYVDLMAAFPDSVFFTRLFEDCAHHYELVPWTRRWKE